MNIALLPGMLCDQRLWQPTIHRLPSHFHCTNVDLLRCNTLAQMKSVAKDHILNADIVVAFSLGGYVAQELMVDSHESFPPVILMGTAGTGLTDDERKLRKQVIKTAHSKIFDPMPNSRARDFVGVECPIETRALVQTMAREAGFEKFIAQLSSTLNRRHTLDLLSSFSKPCLVIAAEEDKIVPKVESKKLAEAIPNSHFISLKKCGHMIPLEQPQLVADIINHFCEKQHA